jgi:hypothetical protein
MFSRGAFCATRLLGARSGLLRRAPSVRVPRALGSSHAVQHVDVTPPKPSAALCSRPAAPSGAKCRFRNDTSSAFSSAVRAIRAESIAHHGPAPSSSTLTDANRASSSSMGAGGAPSYQLTMSVRPSRRYFATSKSSMPNSDA